MNKNTARKSRSLRSKHKIHTSGRLRLVVNKSSRHISSQIIERKENGDIVLVCSSTLDKELSGKLAGNKTEQAAQVGKLLAERAKNKELKTVAFDRSGYQYHGRVKALAEAAREAGLDF